MKKGYWIALVILVGVFVLGLASLLYQTSAKPNELWARDMKRIVRGQWQVTVSDKEGEALEKLVEASIDSKRWEVTMSSDYESPSGHGLIGRTTMSNGSWNVEFGPSLEGTGYNITATRITWWDRLGITF